MTKYYSEIDIEVSGEQYDDRLIASPSIEKSTPEFLAGIEPAIISSVNLSNLDKALTILRGQGQFRGKQVDIRELYILQGTADNPIEVEEINTYVGIIDNSSVGYSEASLNLTTQGLDILDIKYPVRKVTTDLFPDTVDTDVYVNEVFGTAKKVPLPLVLAQETPSIEFKYLVGRGDLDVDVVYRDDLVISEFGGTAQSGTASTIRLASADQHDDDFYNDAYVEIISGQGAGQTPRRITDYVKSTRTASVTPNWSTNPNSTSVYRIREWGRFTETIDSETHTVIKFAITQRDSSGTMFTRDNVCADITGLQDERNPAIAVETILSQIGITVDSTSVTNAASAIDDIEDLFVDGAVTEESTIQEVLNKICLIGRLFLYLGEDGNYYLKVIGTEDTVTLIADDEHNTIDIGFPKEESLFTLWKTVKLSYRKLFSSSEYRVETEAKSIFTDGKIDEVLENDLIFDKTTADKVADFMAKVVLGKDQPFTITVGHEGRNTQNYDLILVNIPGFDIEQAIYYVTHTSIQSGQYTFTVIPQLTTINDYSPGALPTDPVTDSRADFRFTPPQAPTAFGVDWTVTNLNVSANATLTWTNPTENFARVVLEYKKSSDSLWTQAYNGPGESFAIAGLVPGTPYDFRVTSYNVFDLDGGVAQINSSVAPGDTEEPSTPATPVLTRKGRVFTGTVQPNAENELVKDYLWQIWSASAQVGDDIIGGTSLTWNEPNTNSVTRRVRVAARDYAIPPNVSDFSSFSNSLSTEQYVQDDILNDEITNKQVSFVSSVNPAPPSTQIISTSITKRSGTRIRIEFSCIAESLIAGLSGEWFIGQLRRATSTLVSQFATVNLPSNGAVTMTGVYEDNISSSGTFSYNVFTGASGSANVRYLNLILRVLELRR